MLQEVRPVRLEPDKIEPASELTRKKYFNIYTEYSTKHLTHRQLAEQYNYSPKYIKDILRWCAKQLEETDPVTAKEAMIDKVSVHLQRLEEMMDDDDIAFSEKLALLKEIRISVKLLGQAQGLMEGDGRQAPTHIEINLPNLGRGEGVATITPRPVFNKERIINTEVEEA